MINDYAVDPAALDNGFDIALDHVERYKPFKMKEEDSHGAAQFIPRRTADDRQHWYNMQGESIYSNPWPRHLPMVDHKLDEQEIWNFRINAYGLNQLENFFTQNQKIAETLLSQPIWSGKKAIPHFWD